jgi:adenosine kinase
MNALNISPVSTQTMPKINSIIAIGNPIIDITANLDKDSLQKYGLKWGETVFANPENVSFFIEIENKAEVTYIPGGSVQNTLRVASWCLNSDPNNENKNYKLTMLGSVGDDIYKDKVINSLKAYGVNPLLQIIPNMKTSRCAVGTYKKERCLLPEINASNYLSEDFIRQNGQEILNHEALIIEGYFLKEKFELCKKICEEFIKLKKIIILTLCDPFMIEYHKEKILEIANISDMIVGNFSAAEILADGRGKNMKETFEKIHKKLVNKERLLVITAGCQGAFCSKFNYQKMELEFIFQDFPQNIKNSEIVDFNGAGDAFLGGFLSLQMLNKTFEDCCRLGNYVAAVVIKNYGCNFPNINNILVRN